MKKNGKFHYPEVVGNHFLYRHSVDDHNNKQHSPISLEVVWATKYWPNHVFSFLLGVMEVNVNLATTYFCRQNQKGQIEFWKLLVKTLVLNTYYDEEQDNDKKRKHGILAIVSSHYPRGKIFQAQESSQENVSIHNTNALHAPNKCRHTASVPQVSISVQNVLGTIWHVLKTIFQH